MDKILVMTFILFAAACQGGPEISQRRLDLLADLIEQEVALAAGDENPEVREYARTARDVATALRTGFEDGSFSWRDAIATIRTLEPAYRAWRASQGDSPEDIENRVRQFRIAITALELLMPDEEPVPAET